MRIALHKTIAGWLIPVVFGCLQPIAAVAQEESPSAAFRQQVAELRTEGKLRACVELLESALEQWPTDADVWLLLLDIELDRKRYAATLRACERAHTALGGHPGVHLRRGRAYFSLGSMLGEIHLRKVPDGRVGQFWNRWLVVEKTKRAGTFVCCNEQSALFQVRKALDGGCREPSAYLLHARIWQQLQQTELAWAILQAHEATILEQASADVLVTCAELALANDDVSSYLRYERMRAEQIPAEARGALLQHAYEQVADAYARSGRVALQVAFLKRAASLGTSSDELLVQLADGLWALDKHEEATLWYRRALEQNPGRADRGRILERIAAGTPVEEGDEGAREPASEEGTGE